MLPQYIEVVSVSVHQQKSSQSSSYLMANSQSVSLSRFQATIWEQCSDFLSHHWKLSLDTSVFFLIWGALSNERVGL
jgi:hypothetical protein